MSSGGDANYLVDLDVFRGPLDLLLYLVKRDEIDVRDIPIARVAEQFKAYLDVLTLIDVEGAGDFLVMAATLMEIKSKMLLPRQEGEEAEEEDPRMGLVRQLLQYKQFKDVSVQLEELAEQQAARLPLGKLLQLDGHVFELLVLQELSYEPHPRVFFFGFFSLLPGQEHLALDLHQRRRHHQEVAGPFDIDQCQHVEIRLELLGDAGDRDVAHVDLVALDEVKQQVE